VYRQFFVCFAAYVLAKHLSCGGCADIRCIFPLCRKGSKTGTSSRCAGCQGSGMKVSIRQLGPNMIQQMQHVCPDCRGSGQHSKIYFKEKLGFFFIVVQSSELGFHHHFFDDVHFLATCLPNFLNSFVTQVRPLVKRTSVASARDKRWFRTKSCLKFM
jgi:hypothetical protein